MIDLGQIFTLFFVTLGPAQLLRPVAQRTLQLDPAAFKSIVIRAFIISLIGVTAGGFAGKLLVMKWRITLPAIRWAVAYGVVLTTARSLGEFGAVSIVSGGIAGRTQTLTQYVQASYENFSLTGAYAASVELAMLAIVTLLAMTLLKPRKGGHIGNRGA